VKLVNKQKQQLKVFWDVVQCNLEDTDRRFKLVYCLHHQDDTLTSETPVYSEITLMMEAVRNSETSVYSNETI